MELLPEPGVVTQEEPFPTPVVTEDSTPPETALKDFETKDSDTSTTPVNECKPDNELTTTSLREESPVLVLQVQENNSSSKSSSQEMEPSKDVWPRSILKSPSTSPWPSTCPSERSSSSELPSLGISAESQRLSSLTDEASLNDKGSSSDLRAPSPVPDGYVTPSFPLASHSYPLLTVPHVPYTGYTAITIPASPLQPRLPEKQHPTPLQDSSSGTSSVTTSAGSSTSSLQVSFSSTSKELTSAAKQVKAAPTKGLEEPASHISSKFVQDSSKFWYKPGISRDQGKEDKQVHELYILINCCSILMH